MAMVSICVGMQVFTKLFRRWQEAEGGRGAAQGRKVRGRASNKSARGSEGKRESQEVLVKR